MEYRLRAYLDQLFEAAPRTQKAYELKIELTQNLLDKYHSLVSEGKSEEDAYNLTVLSIGDIQELFSGLEYPAENPASGNIPPADVPQKNNQPAIVAIAVMMYILSVVPVIVLGAIPHLELLGIVAMFVIIAAATGLLIYTSSKAKYTKPTGTVVSDFKTWQAKNSQNKELLKAIRSALWPLALALYFVLSFTTGAWHITWIIFLITPAVDGIIRAAFALNGK